MLGVFNEHRTGHFDDPGNAWIGDAVEDGAVLPSGVKEPAPAKAAQMIGNARLGELKSLDQLPY